MYLDLCVIPHTTVCKHTTLHRSNILYLQHGAIVILICLLFSYVTSCTEKVVKTMMHLPVCAQSVLCLLAVADLGFFGGGDLGNPTRTEGVWAYRIILCICEIEHGHN